MTKEKQEVENQDAEIPDPKNQTNDKRKHNKIIFEPSLDGGPVTKSKKALNETALNQILIIPVQKRSRQ